MNERIVDHPDGCLADPSPHVHERPPGREVRWLAGWLDGEPVIASRWQVDEPVSDDTDVPSDDKQG